MPKQYNLFQHCCSSSVIYFNGHQTSSIQASVCINTDSFLALDSGKHLPSHIFQHGGETGKISYAEPPSFLCLSSAANVPHAWNKKDEREREREWGGWAGETADAVITLDICNTFFCWSEAAIFPETRWRHYNTKVEWLHLTDREVQEWGVKARYCYSELFSPLTFMYSNICIFVWSWIHKYIWILCILKYLTVKCNLFVCVCVCVRACVCVCVHERKKKMELYYFTFTLKKANLFNRKNIQKLHE